MSSIAAWQNFYVILGPSAGALIGLQFIVITLIADAPRRGDVQASKAFATPSVVHLCAVLFLSAVITAPWSGIRALSVVWGLTGAGGLVYTAIVTGHLRVQNSYKPVFEDWMFHVLLPFAAYAAVLGSAGLGYYHQRAGMFLVGGGALLLLFIGIHNAWDAVTYHIFVRRRQKPESASARVEGLKSKEDQLRDSRLSTEVVPTQKQ